MTLYKKTLGKWGEERVIQHIEKLGWKLLERNFQTRYGEIDIIAEDHGEIVFIEVKTRTSDLHGEAKESVTRLKQKHILKAVQIYLQNKKLFDILHRIDVITLDKQKDGSWKLEIIKNAVNYF